MGILKSILTFGETEKEEKRRLAKEARDEEVRDDAERELQQESEARHQKEMDKIRGQRHNTNQYTKY